MSKTNTINPSKNNTLKNTVNKSQKQLKLTTFTNKLITIIYTSYNNKYMQQQQASKTSTSNYFITNFITSPPHKKYPLQNSQIMLLYFALESIDVSNQIHTIQKIKQQILSYIYSLQIHKHIGGFLPSSVYLQPEDSPFKLSHIVFTYSALNSLKILGDDLSRINRKSTLKFVESCKRSDGSFSSFQQSDQSDLRFVYAAVCICSILNDFSPIDVQKTISYIQSCYNYDGGFGLRPNCQSHSGGIYTALASLKILGKLDILSKTKKQTILHFLSCRQTFNLEAPQIVGIQGRVGKLPDSCYTFWVGASIQILTSKNLLSTNVIQFLKLCQKQNGSYSKYPFMKAGDPQHTLHSLVGTKIVGNNFQDLSLQMGIKKQKL